MKELACTNISFSYGRKSPLVFSGQSFRFRPGITLLKGYSGCGKTTLLKILAGYLRIQKGTVETPSGKPPTSSAYQRREMSFLFQKLNLLPLASVERNLEMAGELAGLGHAAIHERSRSWINRLGLEPLTHRRAASLSGGQQQRAAIARALMKNSDVILLDEPTSGLDDLNTRLICKALTTQMERKCICLISTHDRRLDTLADEVIDFNRFLPVEGHLLALA